MKVQLKNKTVFAQLGLAIIYITSLIPYIPFIVDDAYISYVYSKNLILGNGLTYNGILVEGYSNPLWTLLMAPFIGLGLDALLVARIVSIFSGLICILLVFRLSLDLTRDNKLVYPFLATSSIIVLAPFLAWTLGGLETVFLSSLIVVLVYVEWHNPPSRKWFSPILLVMIALTRPEGVLVYVIWFIYRTSFTKTQIKSVIIESLFFLIPFSTFLVIRWLSFGFLLPNTSYIKVEPDLSVSIDAMNWLVSFLALRPIFGVLLFSGIFALLRQKPFNKKVLLALGISLGFIGFVIFSGPDWMPHHRFITPIVPLLALPIVTVINSFRKPALNRIMVFLTVISIGFEVFMTYSFYKPLSIEFGLFTERLVQAGEWIKANTDDGDTIAIVDAGALAYYSERKTIDILGLNDVHIAHTKNKMDTEYILDFEPKIIQLHVEFSETGELYPPTTKDQNLSIIGHPEFLECYLPDLDRPADPFYPYLFLRVCD